MKDSDTATVNSASNPSSIPTTSLVERQAYAKYINDQDLSWKASSYEELWDSEIITELLNAEV